MQDPTATMEFRIQPQPRVCRQVREGVAEFALSHGIEREELDHFQTALGEALANAIEHARSEEAIEIEIVVAADRIVATVRDCGIGFDVDPASLPSAVDGISERGRGLPIMRRCSDIFQVTSSPGRGTVVTIGRLLRPACLDVA